MSQSFWRRRAERRIEEARDHGELDKTADDSDREGPGAQTAQRRPGNWHNLVEQRIQEGIEQGLFDNLPGAGKPLNLDEDAFVPEDMRMAFRLLRSNGLAPLWVEVNREIRDDLDRLARFRAHVHAHWAVTNPIKQEHLRVEYVGRIRSINEKILNYNILAPSSLVHIQALILDDELAKFDAVEGQP